MTIRVGVAGTGYWAETVHLPGLSLCPDVEIVGVFGRDTARTKTIAGKFRTAAFSDFDAMLAHVDAVDFAIAPAAQAALAQRAAEAGKHLLLEKPVSLSLTDARALASTVHAKKLATVVFLMRRFAPQIETLVESAIGKRWDSAAVAVHGAALVPGSPYENSMWRHEEGAALWDIGPHVFSILIPVFGGVRTIRARRDGHFVALATEHANGATAEISLTLHAPVSEKKSIYVFKSAADRLAIEERPFPFPDVFARAAGDLVRNIAESQTTHRCNIDFVIEIMCALDAAARSIDAGGRTQTPESAA